MKITKKLKPFNPLLPFWQSSAESPIFRPDTLPMDFQSELTVTRHYTAAPVRLHLLPTAYRPRSSRVDADTGFVKLLKHWCVEDSGHGDQSDAGGLSSCAAAWCRGSARRCSKECLYSPRGPAAQRQHGRTTWCPCRPRCRIIVCAHVENADDASRSSAPRAWGEAGTAGCTRRGDELRSTTHFAPLNARGDGDAVLPRKRIS